MSLLKLSHNKKYEDERSPELTAIEKRFHELIVRRAKEFGCKWADDPNKELPVVTADLVDKQYQEWHQEWFPVPGMYGGFAWKVRTEEDGTPYLIAESWSRVVDGWGQDHKITPDATELLADHTI